MAKASNPIGQNKPGEQIAATQGTILAGPGEGIQLPNEGDQLPPVQQVESEYANQQGEKITGTEEVPGRQPGKKYVVVSSFRDRSDFTKQYLPGEDVSHLEKERLDHLVKHNHVSEE